MSLDHAADLVKQQTPTRDAFLGDRLVVQQPAAGFRAGLDSVLLGAAIAPGTTHLLDLGAGVGTAALVAMAHLPHLDATLVEADPAIAALAVANLAGNAMHGRARVLTLDLTAPGAMRDAAGLRREHFTSVIANPPFYDTARGTAAAPQRLAARQMQAGGLDAWVRTAASHAAPGGEIVFVHLATALPQLLAALGRRCGAITVLPLLPRSGEAASRVLVRGIKGSRAPFTLLAARPLHGAEGRGFAPEFDDIFRGRARLIW